jgi:hypothetical protein
VIRDLLNLNYLPSIRLLNRLIRKSRLFLLLPNNQDPEIFGTQSLEFLRALGFESLVGCNSAYSKASDLMMNAMAECKARVIEEGLLKSRGTFKELIRDSKKLLKDFKGGSAQAAYQSMPSLQLTASEVRRTEEDIDKLRDPLVVTRESVIFSKGILTSFDATRVMMTRPHEILLGNQASLANQLKLWFITYSHLMSESKWVYEDVHSLRAFARKLFRTKVIGTVMPGFPLTERHDN